MFTFTPAHLYLLVLCILLSSFPLLAQPGTTRLTPVENVTLPGRFMEIDARFQAAFTAIPKVFIPRGFTARVFYAGPPLDRPRFMAWSPDSVLHVANKNGGSIVALPDRNRDGVADEAIIVASGFNKPHDMAFYNGALYVAEETRIIRLMDADGNGIYESRSVFIDNIAGSAPNPTGGHDTRTIVFDPDHKKLYLSIGSRFNVARESFRAVIEEYNDDGTGRRIFATGVRNAVGMARHPRTGRIWAANNGSDRQGDDVPPEWVDLVRDGGFYGHPLVHSHQVWFDFNAHNDYRALLPITAADSAVALTQSQPAALLQAHSAPMAIQFSNNSFPEPYDRGVFVAYRGSWNRSVATGYKVVYLEFGEDDDTVAKSVSDFLTGFLTDPIGGVRWARPVGLAVDRRGNLYMSSDQLTEFILMIAAPDIITGVEEPEARGVVPAVLVLEQNYPNPFNPRTTIRFRLDRRMPVRLEVYDAVGRVVRTLLEETRDAGEHRVEFDAGDLPSGTYFYLLSTPRYEASRSMQLIR